MDARPWASRYRPQKPWRAESNKIFTSRAIFFAPVQEARPTARGDASSALPGRRAGPAGTRGLGPPAGRDAVTRPAVATASVPAPPSAAGPAVSAPADRAWQQPRPKGHGGAPGREPRARHGAAGGTRAGTGRCNPAKAATARTRTCPPRVEPASGAARERGRHTFNIYRAADQGRARSADQAARRSGSGWRAIPAGALAPVPGVGGSAMREHGRAGVLAAVTSSTRRRTGPGCPAVQVLSAVG